MQRVFLVKKYYKLKHLSLIQRAFRTKFPKDGTLTCSGIKNIVSYFKKYSSVQHLTPKKKIPDPKRELVKKQLESTIVDFSKLSIRKTSLAIGVQHSCIIFSL